MDLHLTFDTVLSFHALLSTDWVSFNFQKWMLSHFAFYTLIHPMGPNYFIGFNEDSRQNGFTFYIYIVLSFYVLLLTDVWTFIDGCFYILPFTICYIPWVTIISLGLMNDSRQNGFTFYFFILLTFYVLLSTDWVSFNF